MDYKGAPKLILKTNDSKELFELYNLAKENRIAGVLIKDQVKTFLKKKATCLGLRTRVEDVLNHFTS